MNQNTLQTLLTVTVGACLMATTSSAQISSNGTGGGAFSDGTTWSGGTAPTSGDAWTILNGDSVTGGSIGGFGGATNTVQGTLNLTSHINLGGTGGATMNVNGTLSFDRLFSNSTVKDSTGRLNLTAGSMTTSGRISLTNTNTDTTTISSYTQSGGDLDGTGAFFNLYGADADDRAEFSIIGNAGTFSISSAMSLFNTTAGFENSATNVNFTFGTAAGDGALTVVETNGLTLGGNAFIIDFTQIDRSTMVGTTFSTTLFDYGSGILTNSFGTLTSLGLGAGESATLVHDATNKLIRVDYTMSIPEPSTYAALVGLLALGVAGIQRRRK